MCRALLSPNELDHSLIDVSHRVLQSVRANQDAAAEQPSSRLDVTLMAEYLQFIFELLDLV